MLKYFIIIILLLPTFAIIGQENTPAAETYKKRVLESTEINFLSSYYTQDGENAAVSGGIGTESLQDATGTIIVSIPINEDDVLTIDAGVSAYTSASSSNINPFDGRNSADPFVASSGESKRDVWASGSISYAHSSDDRNTIWSGNLTLSSEYDYTSFGSGGSLTKLFNEKNTELSIRANVFVDQWKLLYPVELSNRSDGDDDDHHHFNINNYTITGNPDYSPGFVPLDGKGRNTYAFGLGFSQILSTNLQGSLSTDFVIQQGQLSTPFQRVYFSDVEDSFIENFHLADDIERLPDTRFKVAIGGRLNFYVNEFLTVRTFVRHYFDDWGIQSQTASIELPIKINEGRWTLYPSYRYYRQSAMDYFQPYNSHLSTSEFYTSDYDLSEYNANQFGLGVSYSDVFGLANLGKLGLKSIDLKYYWYDRNTSFRSHLITAGLKLNLE